MPEQNDRPVSEVLWDQATALHKGLSNKFHGLTTAVAFGSLWYLLSLEEHLPPQASQNLLAIQIAWSAAFLSCAFGAVHLWLEMLLPLRSYNIAAKAEKESQRGFRPETVEQNANCRTSRALLWGLPAYLHLLCLILVFASAAYYKFSN